MRVFFNAIVVQIILNAYIFWRGWENLPQKKLIKVSYILIFAIELIVYMIGFLFANRIGMPYIHYIAWVGTTWMLFILYMSAPLLLYDLLRFINKKKRILPEKINLERRKTKAIVYGIVLLLTIGSMSIGYYKFRHPSVTYVNIEIDKPTSIDSLRIVMASDLHAGYLIKKNIIAMYIDEIMKLKPDLILLAGDIIDYDLKSVKDQHMEEEFQRLKAPYGVYGITGNHEYIGLGDEESLAKPTWLSKNSGITMLRDSVVLVDSAFYIVGREDNKYLHRKTLPDIMENVDMTLPVILMNHEPHEIHEGDENGVDISFYGHTHNGQFFPNNLIVKFMYEMPYGYKQINDNHVYVSSGIGLAGPQYRIGTKSEIVVFDVKFTK